MTIIEKLWLFKAQFEKVQEFGRDLPISLFVLIYEDEILKKEFERRLYYFRNLAMNDDFTKTQALLCESATLIILSIDSKKVILLQKELNYKYKNYFKSGKDEIDLLELYNLALDKNNYQNLSRGALYNYTIKAWEVKKQYELIVEFLNLIGDYFFKNRKARIKFYQLIGGFNDIYCDFNEKIEWIPARLSVRDFIDFWNFCGSLVSNRFKEDIQINDYGKIKQVCEAVIDGLIGFLEPNKTSNNASIFSEDTNTLFYSTIEALGNEARRNEIVTANVEGIGVVAEETPKSDGWYHFRTESRLKLDFNEFSGAFEYGIAKDYFSVGIQQYIVFSALIKAIAHIVKYQTLLEKLYPDKAKTIIQRFADGQETSFVSDLANVVKKIKMGLKILPTKSKNRNKDIFKRSSRDKSYLLKLKP